MVASRARCFARSLKAGRTQQILGSSSRTRSFNQRLQSLIKGLQGHWGDDTGVTIQVAGLEARFSDDGSTWQLEQKGHLLVLRGRHLLGTADSPVWKSSSGADRYRYWARAEVTGSTDEAWASKFLSYKEERLEIRRQLKMAFAALDFNKVSVLKHAWEQAGSLPPDLTEAHSALLAEGKKLVPGVCFHNRKYNYRGVIVGCEPWCTYPAAWRARWVSSSMVESQPFYHCLIDSNEDVKDHPRRLVAQENIEINESLFPIESELLNLLLVPCIELGAYLPSFALERALKLQRETGHDFESSFMKSM